MSTFENARYTKSDNSELSVIVDGSLVTGIKAAHGFTLYDALVNSGVTIAPYIQEPVSAPPRIVALAVGITVENGDVSAISGSYNILAALYLGVGQITLLYLNDVPEGSFVSANNGSAAITATDVQTGSCTLEIRDINGNLADTPRLDVAVTCI